MRCVLGLYSAVGKSIYTSYTAESLSMSSSRRSAATQIRSRFSQWDGWWRLRDFLFCFAHVIYSATAELDFTVTSWEEHKRATSIPISFSRNFIGGWNSMAASAFSVLSLLLACSRLTRMLTF